MTTATETIEMTETDTASKTVVLAKVKHISMDANEEVTLLCSSFLHDMNSNFDFSVKFPSISMYCLKHSLAKRFLNDSPVARKHIEDTLTVLKYEDVPEYFVKLLTENMNFNVLEIEKYKLFEKYCSTGRYERKYCNNDKPADYQYSSVDQMSTKIAYFIHTNNLIGKYAEYEYNLFSCDLVLYFYNMILEVERKYIKEREENSRKKWESNPLVQDLSWGGSGWVLNYNNFQEYIESCVWGNDFGHICITKEFGSKKATIDWNDDKDRPRFEVRCSCFGADGYGSSKRNVSLKTAMKFAEDEYVHYLAFVKRSEEKRDRIELAKEQMTALVPSDMSLKFSEHYKNEAYLSSNNVFILKFEYNTVNECYVRIGDSKKQMPFSKVIEFYKMNEKFFS